MIQVPVRPHTTDQQSKIIIKKNKCIHLYLREKQMSIAEQNYERITVFM